jgi:hypothetical protein
VLRQRRHLQRNTQASQSITLRLFMDRYTCYLLIGSPGAGKGIHGAIKEHSANLVSSGERST